MRSKVDFPQPDGPRIAMKSLSATENEIGSIPAWRPAAQARKAARHALDRQAGHVER